MNQNVAIVTGYSSGLGLAFTRELLARDWAVVGVARSPEQGIDADARVVHVCGSVAADDTVDAAFAAANRLGTPKILINCAGVGVFGEVGQYSAQEISKVLEGNLAGLILFTDRAAREFHEASFIINVMSTAAKKLRVAESVYTAAKWGAKAYTRVVREALKAKKSPTRVIEVYPCGMHTPFWDNAVRPPSDGANFPQPQPIAAAVLDAVLSENDSYQMEFTFERS